MDELKILVDARMADWSGVGRYETGLIRALTARDDVQLTALVSPSAQKTLEAKGALANITYIEMNEHPFSPVGTREITYEYQTSDADILHCLQYCVPSKPLQNRPLVVTIHDLIPLEIPAVMPNSVKRWIYRSKNRRALTAASYVIAPSQSTADDIKKHFSGTQTPIQVIAEAADDFGTTPVTLPKEDHPYLLAMGNTRPHKNLEVLVRAMSMLQDSQPNIRLLLAGDKDEVWLKRQYVKYPYMKDKIQFTGAIDDAQLRGYYAQARAFLCPSYYEGFGLPPLEAAAFGIPVVIASASSLPEVLGDAGVTIDAHDVEGWAHGIERILKDASYAQTMGGKAMGRSQDFSWAKAADETVAVYRQVRDTATL